MANSDITENILRNWDGKSTYDLNAVVQKYANDPEAISDLIEFMQQGDLQKSASWIIKNSLEAGCVLTGSQISCLLQKLGADTYWETQLHILQSIPYLPIAKHNIPFLDNYLRHSLTHKNKFVRAWSYNGFYELARQHPGHMIDGQSQRQQECLQFFDLAMKDEAPSVKARIRQLLKKGF